MTYTTDKNKQVYNDIKEGKKETIAKKWRDLYLKAKMEGYSRGYNSALRNNKI